MRLLHKNISYLAAYLGKLPIRKYNQKQNEIHIRLLRGTITFFSANLFLLRLCPNTP